MAYVCCMIRPKHMGEKRTVDVIGSIDDYASEPSLNTTPTRVEDDNWVQPKIVHMENGKVLEGDGHLPQPANPSFIVGENRWGDKVVWPVKPYCVHCSPAAKRDNDDEKTKSFDEYGAERELSRRASRLMGLGPSQYFSFTLKETPDGIICTKCERSPDIEMEILEDETPQGIQKEVEYEIATFDVSKPMLGILVDEGIFRFPEHLVSHWVRDSTFESSDLSILRKEQIYTIKGKAFIKHAIYEEGNKQWLLNPDYCTSNISLEGKIVDDCIVVEEKDIIEWRRTALPLDTKIVAEQEEGVIWGVSQGDFLKNGHKKNTLFGSVWAISLKLCGSPLVGIKQL